METIHTSIIEAIDEIDAAVFSGDTFINKQHRAQLRETLARWERGLVSFDEMDEDEEDI